MNFSVTVSSIEKSWSLALSTCLNLAYASYYTCLIFENLKLFWQESSFIDVWQGSNRVSSLMPHRSKCRPQLSIKGNSKNKLHGLIKWLRYNQNMRVGNI